MVCFLSIFSFRVSLMTFPLSYLTGKSPAFFNFTPSSSCYYLHRHQRVTIIYTYLKNKRQLQWDVWVLSLFVGKDIQNIIYCVINSRWALGKGSGGRPRKQDWIWGAMLSLISLPLLLGTTRNNFTLNLFISHHDGSSFLCLSTCYYTDIFWNRSIIWNKEAQREGNGREEK